WRFLPKNSLKDEIQQLPAKTEGLLINSLESVLSFHFGQSPCARCVVSIEFCFTRSWLDFPGPSHRFPSNQRRGASECSNHGRQPQRRFTKLRTIRDPHFPGTETRRRCHPGIQLQQQHRVGHSFHGGHRVRDQLRLFSRGERLQYSQRHHQPVSHCEF